MTLTNTTIKTAKPGSVIKDASVPGLQLRTFGQRRSFYLYYRNKSGTQRKPKIGDWPTITIDQARQIARKWLAEAINGRDPSKERKIAVASPTFAQAIDTFMASNKLKPGSVKVYQFALALWKKHLGSERAVDITARDINRITKKLADHYAINTVNLIVAAAGSVFRDLMQEGLITANPTRSITLEGGNKRERYLTADEYKRLAESLDHYSKTDPSNVAAIRLLALTGARVSEIVKAKRSWVRGEWLELPDSKTGKKKIYLSPQALDIINAEPSINDSLIGTSTRPQEAWMKIKARAGLEDFRMHDLRHSFASEAISSGLSLEIVGQLLGHKNANTTKRYAHLIDEARIAASNQIADRVTGRMKING